MTDQLRDRVSVLVAYALFALAGLSAGVSGVLLLPQMGDYGVSRTVIGLTFFTGSAGFMIASATSGGLLQRFGFRIALAGGGVVFVLGGLTLAARPPFVAFVLAQLVIGYATGILESLLNAFLAGRPSATARLNRLHAFFGVGALIGPILSTWLLTFTRWPLVWLVLVLVCAPLTIAVWLTYPRRADDTSIAPASPTGPARSPLLGQVLRMPVVLLGAALLAVYVGLELGVGNWGFGYLVQGQAVSSLLAGYTMSGYWLGLTLGRFILGPLAGRIGLTQVGLMYTCLGGVGGAALLTWLVPPGPATMAGFLLLGFFLGPIFPTTMAIVPQLVGERLMPTAIGVMNAGSVVGGSALPWLAGVAAQWYGPSTLMPLAFGLAVVQTLCWSLMTARIRVPAPATSTVDS
jgi:fucose permease